MYKSFFGLRENPFNVNPDPRYLYLTPTIREAMDELTYGVENRKGFILLTGEVGTGKTTLINNLLDRLRRHKTPTAFIFNSHLSVNHLFDFVLTDFGIPVDYRLNSNMLLRLNTWLVERFRAGDSPVLIVDEAQGLSLEVLEEIRLLLNLETASEKLLQIVLAGQPELEDKLQRPELRQLRQRVTLRCNTAPLTREESHGYITERLRIGGATGAPIFSRDAMDAVHFCSRGIPRVINLLCEHALINAYVEQCNPVPAQMVEEAARDFLLDDSRAIGMRPSFGHSVGSNLTVMQSIFAEGVERPCAAEEASLHQPLASLRTPAGAVSDVEDSARVADRCAVPTFPEYRGASESARDVTAAASTPTATPRLPEQEPRQSGTVNSPALLDSPAGPASQLLAEMKRSLAASSAISPIRLVAARSGRGALSAAKAKPAAVKASPEAVKVRYEITSDRRSGKPRGENWVRHAMLRVGIRALAISWQARRYQRNLAAMRSNANTAWPGLAAAAMLWMTQPNEWTRLVQRWSSEFKRDWTAMINAMTFPVMQKSFLRWLRQPIPSNQWRQIKARGSTHVRT